MKHGRTEEWSKWRGLVSEHIASGQTVAAFCRDRGLRDWQFYDWKKRIREGKAAKFVAVEVAAVAKQAPAATGGAIEVRLPRGRSIVIEPGFDAHHLRALLSVLEAEE
jgi:transposase-like protein